MQKIILTLFLIFFSNQLFALAPEKHLTDPKLESRAVNIFKQVKCLVCQGQSIYGSNTEFSENLRTVIRQKISQGLTDQEVKNHLTDEFGKQILFSSQAKSTSESLLYILPLTLALIFLGIFLQNNKRNLFTSEH